MCVDDTYLLIFQQRANCAVAIARRGDRGSVQHAVLTKSAKTEGAGIQEWRHEIGEDGRLLGGFAHVDGIGRAKGGLDIVADMVEQNQLLSFLRLLKRNAAGIAGADSGHAPRPAFDQGLVTEAEERTEWRRGQPAHDIGHNRLLGCRRHLPALRCSRVPGIAAKATAAAQRESSALGQGESGSGRHTPPLPCIANDSLLAARASQSGARTAPLFAWPTFLSGATARVENSSGIQASLAGRYALALFELARDNRQIEAVSASLATLRGAIQESEDLRTLISSPLVGRDEQARGVGAVVGSLGLDPLTGNFVGVLAQNRRLSQLPNVIRAFGLLAAQHRGEVTAEVVSARPLDDDQIAAIRQQLRSRMGRDINVDLSVDPAILGGLVVKIGSQMIDSSIRTKLNNLAHAMKG